MTSAPHPAHVPLSDVRLVDAVTHVHDADELTWVVAGACTIEASGRRWRIDTATTLRIPAGLQHRVVPRPDSIVFPLLFPAGLGGGANAQLVARTPALEACARVLLQPGLATPQAVACARDAASRLLRSDDASAVPLPRDARVRALAQAIVDAPAHPAPLDELARRAHMSGRTVQRHFRRDTGLSFGAWRAEVRLAHARRLLQAGHSVAAAARAAGYLSTSAFVAAFRRRHGVTPGTLAPPP
ncbi:helix-turn-helix transcriptional regulator [Microbacterium luticocti]|uniref:helix-turn-helix transcriptional regulator n=1 Tax=Microbacterium luticocti TaxID=451764 RepID=UPI0006853B9D|nr:AraC family transcriptional regulator [Microbacterium luticocti]